MDNADTPHVIVTGWPRVPDRCGSCGAALTQLDGRLRFNGREWEHQCGHPQAGHFPTAPMPPVEPEYGEPIG